MKIAISFFVVFVTSFAKGKVTILKLEPCDPNQDYAIKFEANFKTSDDKQIVEEGVIKSKVPMGDNILQVIDVSMLENDKYEHLITLKETLCDGAKKYIGEFMHDIQKSMGVEAGTCPIPPGEYKLTNHVLDFEKFKFKKLPAGQIKAVTNLFDVKTNETLNCHNVEFKIEK